MIEFIIVIINQSLSRATIILAPAIHVVSVDVSCVAKL